jgi:hypothetical protein
LQKALERKSENAEERKTEVQTYSTCCSQTGVHRLEAPSRDNEHIRWERKAAMQMEEKGRRRRRRQFEAAESAYA